ALAERTALMLQEDGGARLGLEGQHPARRALGQPERPGEARRVGTGDLLPMQQQGGIAEAGPGERRLAGGARFLAERGCLAPALRQGQRKLFVFRLLGHSLLKMPPPKRNARITQDDPATRLLAWYDKHRRVLPWRAPRGRRADPYHVWLSEIMLQQTTVQAVAGYYRKFLERWPTVEALATASLDDVLAAWAGLGYYARARNLHKAAQVVAGEMGGKFPGTYDGLRALPGIGDYTAGAIASIAFDLPYAAMDANAERVVARLFAIEEPLPKSKAAMRA